MKIAMTSLSLFTATLVAWNCGQVPNIEEAASLQDETSDSGQVAFDRSLQPEEDTFKLVTGWYYVVEHGQGVKRILDGDTMEYWLNAKPIVTAKDIATFDLYKSNFDHSWGLSMGLVDPAAAKWQIATRNSIGGHLAFVVNNKLLSAPQVNAEISGGMTALNRGTYSKSQLKAIMKAIQAEQR
jgi:preprotein translocase subunit SecD